MCKTARLSKLNCSLEMLEDEVHQVIRIFLASLCHDTLNRCALLSIFSIKSAAHLLVQMWDIAQEIHWLDDGIAVDAGSKGASIQSHQPCLWKVKKLENLLDCPQPLTLWILNQKETTSLMLKKG